MIKDYLQTQGLRLAVDEVKAALLALQLVIRMGEAAIEREVLWRGETPFAISEFVEQTPENERVLKQVFMALDSVFSRTAVQSAAVYALMPSENQRYLVRLAQQGRELEGGWLVNDETAKQSLAVRSAQTGWLNLAQDIARWQELGEILGEQHARCAGQLALPICRENGAVLGVIYVEWADKNAISDVMQIQWVALALALLEPLAAWFPEEQHENE